MLQRLGLRAWQIPVANRCDGGLYGAMPTLFPTSQRERLLGRSTCRNLSSENEVYLGPCTKVWGERGCQVLSATSR